MTGVNMRCVPHRDRPPPPTDSFIDKKHFIRVIAERRNAPPLHRDRHARAAQLRDLRGGELGFIDLAERGGRRLERVEVGLVRDRCHRACALRRRSDARPGRHFGTQPPGRL